MSPATRESARVRALAVTFLALGVLSAVRAASPAPQKGGDKTAYVVAFGADNKPVTDLTKDEFAIREDGADRTIVSVKQAADPLDLVLIIDNSKLSGVSIADLKAGLLAFATKIFAGSTPVTMSVVDSAGSSFAVVQNKKTLDDVSKPLQKTFPDQTANTVILEALTEAASQLSKSPTPRRAIVVVNMDGISEGSSLKPGDVLQSLFKSGASLWVVTYQNNDTKTLNAQGGSAAKTTAAGAGNIGMGNVGENRDFVLTKAGGLGGMNALLTVPSALTETLTQVASAITSQYAVTYTRPDGPMPRQFQMGNTREGIKIAYSQIPVK